MYIMPGPKNVVRSQMKLPYGSKSTYLQFVSSAAVGDTSKGQKKNDVLEGVLTFKTVRNVVRKEKYVATWQNNVYCVTTRSVTVDVDANSSLTGKINNLPVTLQSMPGLPKPMTAPVPCQPILKTKLCDDFVDAKTVLGLAEVVVTEFRELNTDADNLRTDAVKRNHVNNKLIRNNLDSVSKIVRQVLNKFLKFENKIDDVFMEKSNEIRKLIDDGITCEELDEDLLNDIISSVGLFAKKYLEFKILEEEELLVLKEEVSQLETVICDNNIVIKTNIEQIFRDEIKIKKLHVKGLFELLDNINNAYKSLPKTLLDTPEFTSFSGALIAVNKEVPLCLPSPAQTEDLEINLAQSSSTAANMLRELFDNKCDKLVEIIDDLLNINKLQQEHVEATLLFDKTPNTGLLFKDINIGLAEMSKVSGLVIERLTRAKNDIIAIENKFQIEFDDSIKYLEKLNAPINCFGDKIDNILECELAKLPMNNDYRKVLVYTKKSFDALRESHSDVLELEGAIVMNLKGSASVSKDIMIDVYDGMLDIIGNEHYKNKVVAKYYAVNTSSVGTLLDSTVSRNIKAVIGNGFILVGIGVRSFAGDVLMNDLPMLPTVTCANLTLVEEDLTRILLKGLGDIIVRSITGITSKIEETRKIIKTFINNVAQGINELSNIEHATQLKLLKTLPKILNDLKISLAYFNDIIRFGLNLTLDAASNTLKC